jgi:hypothetical protein
MRKPLLIVGLALVVLGVFDTVKMVSFTSAAVLTKAKVLALEERTGPPKPTQNTPLHVSFTLTDGIQRTAITRAPLLQKVRQGDEIFVMVNPLNPLEVKLPLPSELWARPLAYLLSGFVTIVSVVVFRGGIRRDWPEPSKR